MTESEWLECIDKDDMLNFLRGKVSERKLRLFAAACVRQVWHLLADDRFRKAVESAEAFADGLLDMAALSAVHEIALQAWHALASHNEWAEQRAKFTEYPKHSAAFAAVMVSWGPSYTEGAHSAVSRGSTSIVNAVWADTNQQQDDEDQRDSAALDIAYEWQSSVLRDIFGNPFRTVSLATACLTPIVISLATAAYEERLLPSGELDTTRLAILADALEEAGCDNADILAHLRGPGPHVRGCCVLDLLLLSGDGRDNLV